MSDKKHLVIASGGTGGHFYPTLAVAREFMLACPDGRVTLLVSGKHAESQAEIAKGYGYETRSLPSVRLPGSLVSLFRFPFELWRCVRFAKGVLADLKPDVLLGMGSFAAVPACFAVDGKKVPLVLHEGNSFVGKANRLFMKKARAIGLSLPLYDKMQLRGCPATEVGMPLRDAIVMASEGKVDVPENFLGSLGLRSNGLKTILVFGGSQGARAINELVTQATALLGEERNLIQFIHLTGTDDNQQFSDAYKKAGVLASVRKADPDIERCYLKADLVICRAGASSICELALFGMSAILIPLPTAADDHQTVNANVLAEAGAACHLPQKDASPDKMAELIKDWLKNPEKWNAYGRKIKSFGKPNAAASMVKVILDV
ncbi:MAG: UDP-N-acetylglucosamine--N-acetylmuramyl-(pentapeptide) pyrophosphoryl-undecaprenol N-acetylglucosamine transferase [Victivallales bacterium]|nr:UDP-N-acetylglucosamine--N-acetylmuramyl-(pentapeptide) pyrophosphoryl-undecaprenol N-acetylglucosamine transferase [Victivallales bacterium]